MRHSCDTEAIRERDSEGEREHLADDRLDLPLLVVARRLEGIGRGAVILPAFGDDRLRHGRGLALTSHLGIHGEVTPGRGFMGGWWTDR